MKKQAQKLRIIGGKWRGSKLPIVDGPGLRPTGNRVRETLFNWIATDIVGARCLDAFAGSGILGLEALSRGGLEVVAFEPAKEAAGAILETTRRLRAENFNLYTESFFDGRLLSQKPFDIVFIDPPFELNLQIKALEYLVNNQCLSSAALVYLERPSAEADSPLPTGWTIYKSKAAGAVWFGLVRYKAHTADL